MDVRALLIDIDGVSSVGDRPVVGAGRSLASLDERGMPYRFVSNATRGSRRSIADRLRGLGFDIPEGRIITPPITAVERMRDSGKNCCFLLASGDVRRDFEQAGVEVADLIALERGRYWMGADGLMLSAGPFVAALEYAAGKRADVVGKPSREFFALALRQMGVRPRDAAMIGDDTVTDIGGAQACGMAGILVRTGKYSEDAVRQSGIHPDLVVDSIAGIPEHL